jgi:hypothetical protein
VALSDRVRSLLGVSEYEGRNRVPGPSIDSPLVEAIRSALGGHLTPPPTTKLEWFLEEVDYASLDADQGDFTKAAQLVRAFKRDPVIRGLLATKSGGVVKLPKLWRGNEQVVDSLVGVDGKHPVFDLMCPPGELKRMADDADILGFSVAELLPIEGRPYPRLERKDPEWVYYRWSDNTWCLKSNAGLIPIEPGNGQWVLHLAGSALCPWQDGTWHALGRSWVRKYSCQHLKDNWCFTLANPARVAVSPKGAGKDQRLTWFQQIAAWGINNVFQATEGWDVKILESNGRGYEGFDSTIKECNEDFMIALAGQIVSTTGGSGFAADDLTNSIRYDLIRDTAIPLAHTISTQVLYPYTWNLYPDAIEESPFFEYEVRRPTDLAAEAAIFTALGSGLPLLQQAADAAHLNIDVGRLLKRFGIDTSLKTPEQIAEYERRLAAAKPEERKATEAVVYTLTKALRELKEAA